MLISGTQLEAGPEQAAVCYSSGGGVFLPFLITSTSTCGVMMVVVGFLAPFLAFLRSLHLKSLVPILIPHSSFAK